MVYTYHGIKVWDTRSWRSAAVVMERLETDRKHVVFGFR